MSRTVLQRLLKYPHAAVFDTSPAPELALRVRNPAGLVWEVIDEQLKLVVGQNLHWDGTTSFNGHYDWGITRREYDLTNITVGELVEQLRADGHDVVFENPELASRGARVLVAGSGDQDTSNGDHLSAYTSLLWCLFSGYAVELGEARAQVVQALRQMVMTQAEGDWLDVWAKLYGVPRIGAEGDTSLQARIPTEVFRLRVNGLAIEDAVKDIAGQTVWIDEPWRRMFTLDVSALSGDARLHDGRYYTYHVIQPVGAPGTDWSKAMPVIERNKAAGIEIFAPRVEYPARHVVLQPPVEYRVQNARVDVRGCGSYGPYDQVLGVMRLSDNEITQNHLVARHDNYFIAQEDDGLQLHQQIQPARNIAMAAIALSDGPESGDENFVLGRGADRVDFIPEPIPSDELLLSHYTADRVEERVEVITIAQHLYGIESPFTAVGVVGRTNVTIHDAPAAYEVPGWSGFWDDRSWLPDWRHSGVAVHHETAE